MNKIFAVLTFIVCFFVACGDDHIIDQAKVHLIQQHVYVVPERFDGDIGKHFNPTKRVYAELGQTMKFVVGLDINDLTVTDESVVDYVSSILWNIDGEFYNISNFRYTFSQAGHKTGYLEIVDQLGDTARTNFDIYVNTPNQVSIDFPYDGYNLAEPTSTQRLPLQWTISGADEWETNNCTIFLSNSPDDVWEKELKTVDCSHQVYLNGSLIGDSTELAKKGIDLRDTSFTIYWAVRMVTQSRSGREYRDSTEIVQFSTRTLDENYSTIKIPLNYANYHNADSVKTKISFIAANGDTIKTLWNKKPTNIISTKIEPQAGLRIYLQETIKTEYAPETLNVDIPPRTIFTTDTVHFVDRLAPQIAVTKPSFRINEKLTFQIYDDGSGINLNRIRVLANSDTVKHVTSIPLLQFSTPCAEECFVSILGEDFAHNPFPNVYWRITTKGDSSFVKGPYSREAL